MTDNYLPANTNIEYFSSWTINGSPLTSRELFGCDQFDIPSNASVANAELSHFYAINSFGKKNTSLTNSTMTVIHQTSSTWSESLAM
jgi:hypothetical protein